MYIQDRHVLGIVLFTHIALVNILKTIIPESKSPKALSFVPPTSPFFHKDDDLFVFFYLQLITSQAFHEKLANSKAHRHSIAVNFLFSIDHGTILPRHIFLVKLQPYALP